LNLGRRYLTIKGTRHNDGNLKPTLDIQVMNSKPWFGRRSHGREPSGINHVENLVGWNHHAAGISRQNFRGASDISGNVQADTTLPLSQQLRD
jgi:hypothetical protein